MARVSGTQARDFTLEVKSEKLCTKGRVPIAALLFFW